MENGKGWLVKKVQLELRKARKKLTPGSIIDSATKMSTTTANGELRLPCKEIQSVLIYAVHTTNLDGPITVSLSDGKVVVIAEFADSIMASIRDRLKDGSPARGALIRIRRYDIVFRGSDAAVFWRGKTYHEQLGAEVNGPFDHNSVFPIRSPVTENFVAVETLPIAMPILYIRDFEWVSFKGGWPLGNPVGLPMNKELKKLLKDIPRKREKFAPVRVKKENVSPQASTSRDSMTALKASVLRLSPRHSASISLGKDQTAKVSRKGLDWNIATAEVSLKLPQEEDNDAEEVSLQLPQEEDDADEEVCQLSQEDDADEEVSQLPQEEDADDSFDNLISQPFATQVYMKFSSPPISSSPRSSREMQIDSQELPKSHQEKSGDEEDLVRPKAVLRSLGGMIPPGIPAVSRVKFVAAMELDSEMQYSWSDSPAQSREPVTGASTKGKNKVTERQEGGPTIQESDSGSDDYFPLHPSWEGMRDVTEHDCTIPDDQKAILATEDSWHKPAQFAPPPRRRPSMDDLSALQQPYPTTNNSEIDSASQGSQKSVESVNNGSPTQQRPPGSSFTQTEIPRGWSFTSTPPQPPQPPSSDLLQSFHSATSAQRFEDDIENLSLTENTLGGATEVNNGYEQGQEVIVIDDDDDDNEEAGEAMNLENSQASTRNCNNSMGRPSPRGSTYKFDPPNWEFQPEHNATQDSSSSEIPQKSLLPLPLAVFQPVEERSPAPTVQVEATQYNPSTSEDDLASILGKSTQEKQLEIDRLKKRLKALVAQTSRRPSIIIEPLPPRLAARIAASNPAKSESDDEIPDADSIDDYNLYALPGQERVAPLRPPPPMRRPQSPPPPPPQNYAGLRIRHLSTSPDLALDARRKAYFASVPEAQRSYLPTNSSPRVRDDDDPPHEFGYGKEGFHNDAATPMKMFAKKFVAIRSVRKEMGERKGTTEKFFEDGDDVWKRGEAGTKKGSAKKRKRKSDESGETKPAE